MLLTKAPDETRRTQITQFKKCLCDLDFGRLVKRLLMMMLMIMIMIIIMLMMMIITIFMMVVLVAVLMLLLTVLITTSLKIDDENIINNGHQTMTNITRRRNCIQHLWITTPHRCVCCRESLQHLQKQYVVNMINDVSVVSIMISDTRQQRHPQPPYV